MSTETALPPGPRGPGARSPSASAGYGTTLTVTATVAVAAFLILMSIVLLLVQPNVHGLGSFSGFINQQNQGAKTALYLCAFLVVLPLSLVLGPRLSDAIAAGPNRAALPALATVATGTLAGVLIVLRLLDSGLAGVLIGVGLWSLVIAAVLSRASRPETWPRVLTLERHVDVLALLAGALLVGVLLCVTSSSSLSPVRLVVGAAVAAAASSVARARLPRPGRPAGWVLDALVVVLLLLAVPDTVIFHPSSTLPNAYFEPGVIQFQHDYILGPTNQLLGGGALLVNVPVSQYGVGLIYFLAGWFHLAPIGYGTFGFLDGVLTALFYVAAYGALRIAGVGRLLAAAALGVALIALVYNLQFAVGALPEQGPLRFGLPMLVLLAAVGGARWPRHRPAGRVLALGALGVSSVWALEAFAYTLVTFAAVSAAEAWLLAPGERRRWLGRRALLALAACVVMQGVLAVGTLVGTGHLPAWGQYLSYAHAVLLGGAGQISYGFARWPPGLAVGAGALASAAAIVLLARRRPALARREPAMVIALAGATAYEIAVLSYADNRSSTYLLPYISLPLVMCGVLWLALLLRRGGVRPRRGAIAFALAVAALLVSVAWPQIGGRFSRSALAHAYPGGGLRAAIHRLWHAPPIDPRAPEGERLLARDMPGQRALIVLPTVPDLGTEILMRSGKANSMFIGDPKADTLVPSVWLPKVSRSIAELRPGTRLLTNSSALGILATLRARPSIDPLKHNVASGVGELEWILVQIDRRFALRPVYRDPDGLIVAELSVRGS